MARTIGPRQGPKRRERPDRAPAPAPPRGRAGPTAAERDLLAAILDSADHGLEEQLPAMAASLARCAGCRCAGIALLDGEGISWAAAGGAGFQRLPGVSFPGPAGRLCDALLAGDPGHRPSGSAGSGAYVRNTRSGASPAAGTPAGPTGICAGTTFFESVALLPVRRLGTTVGLMFVGDERPGRISPRAAAFMRRAGSYLGSTIRPVPPAAGSPGAPAAPAAAAPVRWPDEMDLVSRLIENAGQSIMISQDWRILYVNQRYAESFGRSREEMIGTPVLGAAHPEDRASLMERYSRIMNGERMPSGAVARGTDAEGRTRWLGVREMPFTWHGRPAIMHLVSDITDRIRAEEELRQSEERYRRLVETSNEAIAVIRKWALTFISPRIEQMTGYRVGELLGRPFTDFVHPDDLPMVSERYARGTSGEEPSQAFEVRFIGKAGGVIWAHVNTVELDWEGQASVLALISDITEWKRAEQALKASEERFRTLLENSRDAVAVVDERLRIVYGSPSMAAITGHSAERWTGMKLADIEVHPDELPAVVSRIRGLLRQPGRVIQDVAVRYRHSDGSWHVLEVSSRNLLHDPRVRGLVFNFRDITARRRIEHDLEESEQRYRLLAENASDVIFTADLDLRLTYVSPSIRELTGYGAPESSAMDLDSWLTPASKEGALAAYQTLLTIARAGVELSPSQHTATVELQRRDGRAVWAEVRIDFLRDAAGDVTGLVGVARDITDRRAADMERERRQQMQELISEISTAFISLPSESVDAGVRNALAAISWFTGADRSHIFTFSQDGSTATLDHEWCSGAVRPLGDRLSRLSTGRLLWLMDRIRQGQAVQVARMADLPPEADGERALLEAMAVGSAIAVPMVQEGHLLGALVLASTDEGRTWDSETVTALLLVAEMFSNALARRRIDLALRESERRYRLLADNITDVIWTTDLGPRITYMSPSATRLVGYTPEELRRLTVADLLTADSLERGLKAMGEHPVAEALQADDPSANWVIEVELRRKDGSTFWAEEQVAFMRDERGTPVGLVGVTRDISQRRAMQEALRLSEQRYRNLVEASPDGVLSLDGRGTIIDGNPAVSRLLGYERQYLPGMEVRRLMAAVDLGAGAECHTRLAAGEVVEMETEAIRRDGQLLPVWLKVVMLPDTGAAGLRPIVYIRDIASRRKLDEMKDQFISLVSHELRSPLTVIIGALNTAISEGPRLTPKETAQLLQDAALEAEQLSHLVGNLLELSRSQADRLFLHVEPVNLSSTVRKVVRRIKRQSPRHRFAVDLPARLPPVPADPLRLERVLHNLLENSVKYSPEDTEIRVSASREADRLVVSIADRGPGISREDQARLFQPFQQLGHPLADHNKGAGLGLLVCHRLVEAHGGRIWVESEPGQGATFRFTIQAGPAERRAAAPTASGPGQ